MRGKISKRTVEAFQSGLRDTFLWDTELPGFGCKVTPKGRRIYMLQFKNEGRDHRATIGRHGIDVTPKQARLKTVRLRGQLAAGDAPASGKQRAKVDCTVAELGTRYLDEYALHHKKPSGIAQDRRNLDNHVVPLVGPLTVRSVERSDISRMMREIALGKTAKTKRPSDRVVGSCAAKRLSRIACTLFSQKCSRP